ncbi:hypothetical protein HMPREF1868_00316 [Olsenella sp. DNF00959]|nr:hypothetical protein HMPREF1868_00316 [Olsenella sp. DNF00959]
MPAQLHAQPQEVDGRMAPRKLQETELGDADVDVRGELGEAPARQLARQAMATNAGAVSALAL